MLHIFFPRASYRRNHQQRPCTQAVFGDHAATSTHWPAEIEFYKERTIDPLFEAPPDSLYVRKIITGLYRETGVYRDVAWTIHPRYFPRWFKTKILFEVYPASQGEVDGMLAALGLKMRVIYDP